MSCSCIAALTGACAIAFSQTPSLTLIAPPSGRLDTFASAMSSDGRFVTGYTAPSGGGTYGFTWSRPGGLVEWGSTPGVPFPTQPTAISEDGRIVAGTHEFVQSGQRVAEGFRYANGTYQSLGAPPSPFNRVFARGMSGDGAIAVGYMDNIQASPSTAMRWTSTGGLQIVGRARPTDFAAGFTGISCDGSTAFGYSAPGFDGGDAYTWTESGGWRLLPVPSGVGSQHDARPNRSNANGSIVVGYVQPVGLDSLAVVWNNGVPMTLGGLGARNNMAALAVSDNGLVIGGNGRLAGTYTATIWLNGNADAVIFQDYLSSLGVATPTGWRLTSIDSVSADGMTILGTALSGARSQAFIATIPAPAGLSVLLCCATVLSTRRRRAPYAPTR